MKLRADEVMGFCNRPPGGVCGALFFGADDSLVRAAGARLADALAAGTQGTLETTRLEGAAVRRDPAALHTALRSQGFFAARTLVTVENATDAALPAIAGALEDLTPEDGFLCVLAGELNTRSKLRAHFEKARNAAAGGLYPKPLTPQDLRARLEQAGLKAGIEPGALERAATLLAEQPHGVVAQSVEKIAVYGLDRDTPVTDAEIVALVEASDIRDLDMLVQAIGHRRADDAAALVRKATGRGTGAVQICLALQRHMRRLHEIAASGDPEGAIAALRPPVFGPRKNDLLRQARGWPLARAEAGLRQLSELDATLRDAGSRPDVALLERAVVRLALT